MRIKRLVASATVVAALTGGVAACGDDDDDGGVEQGEAVEVDDLSAALQEGDDTLDETVADCVAEQALAADASAFLMQDDQVMMTADGNAAIQAGAEECGAAIAEGILEGIAESTDDAGEDEQLEEVEEEIIEDEE